MVRESAPGADALGGEAIARAERCNRLFAWHGLWVNCTEQKGHAGACLHVCHTGAASTSESEAVLLHSIERVCDYVDGVVSESYSRLVVPPATLNTLRDPFNVMLRQKRDALWKSLKSLFDANRPAQPAFTHTEIPHWLNVVSTELMVAGLAEFAASEGKHAPERVQRIYAAMRRQEPSVFPTEAIWVDATQQLPELKPIDVGLRESARCLIVTKRKHNPQQIARLIETCSNSSAGLVWKTDDADYFNCKHVTHWRDLPELPS